MSPLRLTMVPLLDERRGVTYAIVFGIWAEVFLYCVVHDQFQLTCYAVGGVVGIMFLGWIAWHRRRI